MKTIHFIVNSNLLIAFAATFLALSTSTQVNSAPFFQPYVALIFFLTLFDYTFHRYIGIRNLAFYEVSSKLLWAYTHVRVLKIILFLSMVLGLTSFIFVNTQTKILIVFLAIPTLLYSLAELKQKRPIINFKKITGLKTILIALVWTIVTVIIPALETNNKIGFLSYTLMLAERFTFIFALAIPFDFHDIDADLKSNFRTFANSIGIQKSIQLSFIFFLVSLLIAGFHYFFIRQIVVLFAYALSTALVIFVLFNKKLLNNREKYNNLLDMCLLLHGLFIFLSRYLIY